MYLMLLQASWRKSYDYIHIMHHILPYRGMAMRIVSGKGYRAYLG